MTAVLTRTLKLTVPPTVGKDVEAVRLIANEFLRRDPPTAPENVQRTFGAGMLRLLKDAADEAALPQHGVISPKSKLWKAFEDADVPPGNVISAKARRLLAEYEAENPRRKVPALGPVQPGGVSLLNMSLTHPTSSIALFPAVDTAWGGGGGVTVIAPENCEVDTKDTSSSPGEAVYLTGDSGLRYWIGHLDRDWPLGHRFKKGGVIGTTLPIPGQSDHAHWGVNAEALLGKGKELKWGRTGNGPPYTLGAPSVGEQLRKWAQA